MGDWIDDEVAKAVEDPRANPWDREFVTELIRKVNKEAIDNLARSEKNRELMYVAYEARSKELQAVGTRCETQRQEINKLKEENGRLNSDLWLVRGQRNRSIFQQQQVELRLEAMKEFLHKILRARMSGCSTGEAMSKSEAWAREAMELDPRNYRGIADAVRDQIVRTIYEQARALRIRATEATLPDKEKKELVAIAEAMDGLSAQIAAIPLPIPKGPPKDAEGKPVDDTKAGLYQKYIVTRGDGSSEPGGKHEKCRYFVLDLLHDQEYARVAIKAYATACQEKYPLLAADLEHIFCVGSPFLDGHTHKEKP